MTMHDGSQLCEREKEWVSLVNGKMNDVQARAAPILFCVPCLVYTTKLRPSIVDNEIFHC